MYNHFRPIDIQVILVLLSFLPATTRQASADDTESRRVELVAAYRPALERLRAPLSNLLVTGHRNEVMREGNAETIVDAEMRLYALDADRQCEFRYGSATTLPHHPKTRVYSYSASSFFDLEKSNDEGDFFVKRHTRADEAMAQGKTITDAYVGVWIDSTFRVTDLTVLRLLEQDGCRIVAIDSAPPKSGTVELVRVSFERREPGLDRSIGSVTLDPEFDYAVTAFELLQENEVASQTTEGTLSLKRWGDRKIVFPDRVLNVVSIDRKAGEPTKAGTRSESTFREVETGAVEPSQFRLSAYGLPDVAPTGGDAPRRLSRPMAWVLALNVALALLGTFILWKRSARKRAQAH
jgi:hypothetical protein